MHQVTGFYFFTKDDKKYVVYSTLYKSGRYASFHEYTGLTDEQARGRFIIEHSKEVDSLLMQKQSNENKSKIILS
jgi:hypothetical protein